MLDLVRGAEEALGGQNPSSSLDGVQTTWFLVHALYCVPAARLPESFFIFCQLLTLVCHFSAIFWSPNLLAMIPLLFKTTQILPCCFNQEPWMKHFYFTDKGMSVVNIHKLVYNTGIIHDYIMNDALWRN